MLLTAGLLSALVLVFHLGKAFVAVDGSVAPGLKGYLRFAAARLAYDIVIPLLCP